MNQAKSYPIAPNGIFWTIQGEGALSGEPMAFIRLAGCSVGCPGCDTDYRVAGRLAIEQILREVHAVTPRAFLPVARFFSPWVWLTGGEPTDHDIEPLVSALRTIGYRVALATAGTRDITGIDLQWTSVSAHSLPLVQCSGHELKVVPRLNGLTWAAIALMDKQCYAFHFRYVQPLSHHTTAGPEADGAADRESLDECIRFVKMHPGWRLGSQAHKGWHLP